VLSYPVWGIDRVNHVFGNKGGFGKRFCLRLGVRKKEKSTQGRKVLGCSCREYSFCKGSIEPDWREIYFAGNLSFLYNFAKRYWRD